MPTSYGHGKREQSSKVCGELNEICAVVGFLCILTTFFIVFFSLRFPSFLLGLTVGGFDNKLFHQKISLLWKREKNNYDLIKMSFI